MASAPFSTAAFAQSQSPAGASSSGTALLRPPDGLIRLACGRLATLSWKFTANLKGTPTDTQTDTKLHGASGQREQELFDLLQSSLCLAPSQAGELAIKRDEIVVAGEHEPVPLGFNRRHLAFRRDVFQFR